MKDIKVGKRLHVLSSDSPSSKFSLKGCDLTFDNKAAMILNNVNINLQRIMDVVVVLKFLVMAGTRR